ncbi:MAG: hypothetical protein AAB320_08195 [Elusimicrobiota bacterium]
MWIALLALGGLVLFVGGVMFLIAAFKEDALWGIGVLLIGPLELVFLILHWDKACSGFFVQLAGIGVMLFGFLLAPADVKNEVYKAMKLEMRAQAEAAASGQASSPPAAVPALPQPAPAPAPAPPAPPPDTRSPERRMQDDCASELGMLCNNASTGKAQAACLRANKDSLGDACRSALAGL